MGLFGNKREKCEKGEKYEHHPSSKGGRSGVYGPSSSSYIPLNSGNYFDGYGQGVPQGKINKYDKYPLTGKHFYGLDPMQQAMFLPPSSPAAMQAQATAILQMQQFMQGQGGGAQFAGILPPVQMPLNAAQQPGLFQVQPQPFYGFAGQQTGTPYFDPNNPLFQQQQQQQGAFAPYQQPNFYDPAAAGAFTAPYGYMPAAF